MKTRAYPSTFAAALALALVATPAQGVLLDYDAAIAADHGGGAGALPYQAVLTESVTLDGTNQIPFDFGSISGAATFEFILAGDPGFARDGFLAVGENTVDNLRYEQWDDTGNLGFTRLGVADYDLGVPSPTEQTHITYLWDGTSTMTLFVNGVQEGEVTGAQFAMPTGAGFLGAKETNAENMVGVIDRVTTYDFALEPAQIAGHANAFLIPEPATYALSFGAVILGLALLRRRR